MRPHRTALLVLPLLAALGACSSGSPKPVATAAPTGDPCTGLATATAVPASCAPTDGPTSDPSSTITATPQLPPLKLGPDKGQLAAGGNNVDASITTMTFSVTLPVGTVLKIHSACEGNNLMSVTTVPESKARQEFNCGFGGVAAEVAVSDDTVARTPTHYVVTVKTTPPARWWVDISGSTDPAPSPI